MQWCFIGDDLTEANEGNEEKMNRPEAGLRFLGWLLCHSGLRGKDLVEGGVEEVGGGGARGGLPGPPVRRTTPATPPPSPLSAVVRPAVEAARLSE